MHTFSETGAGVPAFLAKLWRLVDDPDTSSLICWSKDGRSFIIQNQAQFARELLPLNYKHNNMASFIRQLNMYGFHKITSIDNGGLKFDRDDMEFSHPCFKRNCPYLLEHIKRKIANTKSLDEKASGIKPEAVSKVLQDVKAMRGRQDSLDSRFSVMKQENEALWREIASLRQKHAKQQQIVNKLIQFLITIVQPSRNMTSVKRHIQLMINDTPENAKLRKTSESGSDCGPVIRELGEELLDEVEAELINPQSPYMKASAMRPDNDSPSPLNIDRPHSSISFASQNYDYSNQSADDVLNVAAGVGNVAASGGSGFAANGDGFQFVYHVTEVPDAHPQETAAISPNYNEENVLTTPLARQELARSQLLKQKNKQRRKQAVAMTPSGADGGADHSVPIAKLQRTAQAQAQAASSKTDNNIQLNIKCEHGEIDPMVFLNAYPDKRGITPDQQLFSPNLSDNSRQSAVNAISSNGMDKTASSTATTRTGEVSMTEVGKDLYNPEEFITDNMPADIFEDGSLMADNNSNMSDNLAQQQYGLNTTTDGKFSSYIAGNGASANGASTSAAAAAAAAGGTVTAAIPIASTSANAAKRGAVSQGKNSSYNNSKCSDNNIVAITKYKSVPNNGKNMCDEVNGHLDNVQGELESLKDLLRSDSYSLDANTLMGPMLTQLNQYGTSATVNNNINRIYLSPTLDGEFFNKLFNDSEVLSPYGLHLTNDASNDKKGSELMAYQPLYDLSDIMNMNDEAELDDADAMASATVSVSPPSSGLNTPTSGGRSLMNTPYRE